MELYLTGSKLDLTTNEKIPGVVMVLYLSWDLQIDYLLKKLSISLRESKKSFNNALLYNILIKPTLEYSCNVARCGELLY